MRRHHLSRAGMACLAVLVLGTGAVLATTAAARVANLGETAKSKAAVIAVDEHWLQAEVSGDIAWLDGMLLPDYRSVGADGVAHPKAAIVAHAAKNRGSDEERHQVEAWMKAHPSGKSVVIQDNTAVLSFYNPALGPQKGVRSSDIFVYDDGRWRAIYSQHSAAGSN